MYCLELTREIVKSKGMPGKETKRYHHHFYREFQMRTNWYQVRNIYYTYDCYLLSF